MSKEQPLDSETYGKVLQCLVYARSTGRNLVEVLHVAGLLLSPAKVREIRVEAVREVHRNIASHRPAEFLEEQYRNSRNSTPKDMYDAMLTFVEAMIAHEKEK